jgi:hypothetical protein
MTLTTVCCVCGKIKTKSGEWMNDEAKTNLADLSHTYCPRCRELELIRAGIRKTKLAPVVVERIGKTIGKE